MHQRLGVSSCRTSKLCDGRGLHNERSRVTNRRPTAPRVSIKYQVISRLYEWALRFTRTGADEYGAFNRCLEPFVDNVDNSPPIDAWHSR